MKTPIAILSILTVTASTSLASPFQCRGWLYRTDGKGMDRATEISPDDGRGYIASLEVSVHPGFIYKAVPSKTGGMELSIENEISEGKSIVLAEAENAETLRVRVDRKFNAAIICEKE